MEPEKLVRVTCRSESTHLPFPLTGWLMRDFDSIGGVSLDTMTHVAEGRSYGSRVASQFVDSDAQWCSTLTAQKSSKESFRGALIPARLDQNVDHIAVLIHGSPEILLLAIDSNEDLILIPVVAEPSLASLQFPGIVRTELLTPLSNRLIRHDDSPLGEKILDISKA